MRENRETYGQTHKHADCTHTRTNTHTRLTAPLSGTTRVSWYQKGKTNLDFTEARDSEWQWYQLGHMQVCTSLQTDNHASTPPLSFFTGRMPFLPPNQRRQSTEGNNNTSQNLSSLYQGLNWEDPTGSQIRQLLFEIHYL